MSQSAEAGDERRATIYTDGACSANGCKEENRARAGIGIHWPDNAQNNISEPLSEGRQTSQRAEIIAASRGIAQAKSQGYREVTVRTDSNYVKNAAESWIPNWDRDGWTKAIVNKSEFLQLKVAMEGIKVNFVKVASKENSADKLAKEGAKKLGAMCRRFIR